MMDATEADPGREEWERGLIDEGDEGQGMEEEPEGSASPPEDPPVGAEDAAEQPPEAAAGEEEVTGQEPAPVEEPAKPAEPAPAAAQPTVKPFVPKADGREIRIEGAVETESGWIAMPKASFYRDLQPHLASREEWIRKERDYRRRLDEKSDKEIRAEALVEHFSGLLEQGPDAVYDWLQGFDQNRALLELELKNRVLEDQNKRRESQERETGDAELQRRFAEWAPQALQRTVERILQSEEFKDSGLEVADVYARLEPRGSDLFFTADEKGVPEWGVLPGHIAPKMGTILEEVRGMAAIARKVRASAMEVQKAKAANASVTGEKKTIPPAVSTKGAPSVAGKKKPPTSKREWEDSLLED